MATTLNSPAAFVDNAGNIVTIDFSGTSNDCSLLRIEVNDPVSGDLLLSGPVIFNGTNWSKSFTSPDDFLPADISCDKDLEIILKCRDTTPSRTFLTETKAVSCAQNAECSITINSAAGIASNPGLQRLTIQGTASCTPLTIRVVTSTGITITKSNVPVNNNQWQAIFNQGDPGVGNHLKDYHCKQVISIIVECANAKSCNKNASLEVTCGGKDCPETAEVQITGPNNFNKTNPTDTELECLPGGNYTIKCITQAGNYKWRSNDILVNGPNNTLQVVSVNGDTMVIRLNNGDDIHFSVTAEISADCEPLHTIAFHCGGAVIPDPPVDCVVSEWSDWSPCINDQQTRTRTIITQPRNGGSLCPPLIETHNCHDSIAVDCVLSNWSAWSKCKDGRQTRTRTITTPASNGGRACPTLTETRACSDIIINLCLLWMFINLGLLIVTAIVIFIAFCIIGADTWAAIAALASGGTLAAVFATLSAAVIAMLIAAVILAVITLVSFILWIILCLFMSLRDIMCDLINFILFVLHILMAFAFVIGIILAVIAYFTEGLSLGCAVGAFVDVGWFTIIEQIFFWIGVLTGCIRPFNIFNGLSLIRKTGK